MTKLNKKFESFIICYRIDVYSGQLYIYIYRVNSVFDGCFAIIIVRLTVEVKVRFKVTRRNRDNSNNSYNVF